MPIHDELCYVQFLHPGKEHGPDSGRFKDWNRDQHKRKFVQNLGRHLRDGKPCDGLLRFWTEWEPQSDVDSIRKPVHGGPHFVHQPFYVVPPSYNGLQNTDPFVFGSRFFYTCCQQRTVRGETQLKHLDSGSVVLFGSCVGGGFAIDTVFVVGKDPVEHTADDFGKLQKTVPEVYWDVTIRPLYESQRGRSSRHPCAQGPSWRLYRGATIDDPENGMFSFFPCAPAEQSPNGFARPVIVNPAIISNRLNQARRVTCGLTPIDVKRFWNDVCKQVESANLCLGVSTEMPKRRDGRRP
jgi:hypothetical protein